MEKLNALIVEAQAWRTWHRDRRRYVDAAACAIREEALKQARDAILAESSRRGSAG